MNAIDSIQMKIYALQEARQYLLVQQPSPSNMAAVAAAVADVDRMISDLMVKEVRANQVRANQVAPLPSISPAAAASLQTAVLALQAALLTSAAVSQILTAASALASLPGDDPTQPP